MDWMTGVALATLPGAVVVYGVYKLTKLFIDKEENLSKQEASTAFQNKHREYTLPLRLQAYERMSIFLERISPVNLIQRISDHNLSALEAQQLLIHEIREEYNYNVSQQLYITDKAWQAVSHAKEEVVSLINRAGAGLAPDAPGIELAKGMYHILLSENRDVTGGAQSIVREEGRVLL